ncbi:MAG: carbonate dehydratase [Planctomycetota bacterium]|jgi:carbonic anhydrase
MTEINNLLESNRRWAARIKETHPEFFETSAKAQAPEYLWIGCADSRVPASEVVGLKPGELFVHRNIANLVNHTDMNSLSVLQYAVDVLKVKHVIVCGHYGCGGVKAAMDNVPHGLIDNWLRHIQDVIHRNTGELEGIGDAVKRADRLCELNVLAQVTNVGNTTIMQDAWSRGQDVTVHGLIYGIADGLLKELGICVASLEDLRELQRQSG